MTGKIGLWTSCSQVSFITPDNPLGLGRGLLTGGPNAVAREEWIPALDRAADVLGYKPSFKTWMDKGQVLKAAKGTTITAKVGDPQPAPSGIMCVDSYSSLIASGTGKPWEYATAYRETKKHCDKLFVYHGCPAYSDKADSAWLAPIWESEAIPVFDAIGDSTDAGVVELAMEFDRRGREFAAEPFIAPQTLWFSRKTPCFVMLQTVRDTIRKNWSPATGAARDYPYVNVLIGNVGDIDEDEVDGYLSRRRWNVFVPMDTPAATLAKFSIKTDAPPPPPPPDVN